MIPKFPDDSRDERILRCLGRAMTGWVESTSIAYSLRAPESEINKALVRLEAAGKIQRRELTGVRKRTEWAVKS